MNNEQATNTGTVTTPAQLLSEAYSEQKGPAIVERVEVTKQGSGFDLLKDAYSRPKQETGPQGLSSGELEDLPEELRDVVNDIHKQIQSASLESGVKVEQTDPEYRMVQAEIEDPTSSLTRTLLASQEAAEAKKARLGKMSTRDIVNGMYDRRT